MALIVGTIAAETLNGTPGNDTIIGDDGSDVLNGNGGNDVFQWDAGDGNDTVEGGIGTDTLRFTGSADPETISIAAAAGGRIAVTRDPDAVALDVNDVERIEVKTLGGGDLVFVNDLTDTDAKQVTIDLGIGAAGDGASDTVFVYGSDVANTINVGSAGKTVSVTGIAAPVLLTHTESIDFLAVTALGGDDKINAAALAPGLIQLYVFGDNGNDTVTGSLGADNLIGNAGNDVLLGNAGNDTLNGSEGNDTLTGGKGDDQVLGGIGADRMVWNPGDGNDVIQGGDDFDTAEVNGSAGADTFTVTANGASVIVDGAVPGAFSLDITTTETVLINGKGGNDKISGAVGLAALTQLQADGGDGNDTLVGGNGADFLLGGNGNDFFDGNQGNDTAFLGAGNDVFQWDPGDGSDIVEGQDGTDTLLFNGSAGAEIFAFSPNGGRVLFTRNVGNIVMDLDNVETFKLNALGGADIVTVNNLASTDAKLVAIDLSTPLGAGDAQPDSVTVNAAVGNDTINVALAGKAVSITGLSAQVTIAGAEAANDTLSINGLGGNDKITSTIAAAVMQVTLDGGAGNDTVTGGGLSDQVFGNLDNDSLLGGAGNDTLFGGDGNDTLTGGKGDDQFLGELGDDRMVWNPGDGTDLVEGGDGFDIAEVNGGNSADVFIVSDNGARVLLQGITPTVFSLDIGTTERVVINGKGGNDSFLALGGLAALTLLTMDGGDGNDTLLGGNGTDILLGGNGNDSIDGNQANDTAFLGAGNDVFQWDPGDGSDIVEGQAGTDTLLFNGSAGAEIFALSANGGRLLFTRNVGNIVMDVDDVETVKLNALGGIDTITVNDLTGTDTKLVAIDLTGSPGGIAGDVTPDSVFVNGNIANNAISLTLAGGAVAITGLSEKVTIAHADATDTLTIFGLGGNDGINASKLPAGTMQLTLDGGAGNDTLTGGGSADQIFGGDGKDALNGGAGDNLLNGGAGDDTINVSTGNDIVQYSTFLDGHDVIVGFDGNPVGGQDTIDLDGLFDNLGVLAADRAARVAIVDNGTKVDVMVDADGIAGFEVTVATLNTADVISVGQDVVVGS